MINAFNEDDKKKVIEFLNFTAKHAKFEVNTQEIIEYFKLLSYAQQTLIPKIDANVFQITKIVEPPLTESKKEKKSK
jgi:hypothetical protein